MGVTGPLGAVESMSSEETRLRILCIGAHPDDCELGFAGTAVKFARAGHAVKFLSVTNGDAGHATHSATELAAIRCREMHSAARRLGIAAAEVLGVSDGQVQPSIAVRDEIVRRIREWRCNVVLTHRPWDYHPDHRYTSQLVQDSAYLVTVPKLCPDAQALAANPVYMYLEDSFEKPLPFSPDVVVDIDCTWENKVDSLDAHASQFYEWLPWLDGKSDEVPGDPVERRKWLEARCGRVISPRIRMALERRYGPEHGASVSHAEAFELCEYGRQASAEELDAMFPR